MMKKVLVMIFATVMGISLVACGDETEPTKTEAQNTQQQQRKDETMMNTDERESSEERMSEFTTTSTEPEATTPEATEPEATTPEVQANPVAKINGGADEAGIYSIVVRMTDQAADKGVVDMVYYGEKGSPQENSIVSTFRIEYDKLEEGTFEIQTFFDGELLQKLHNKDQVKVVNTFDATLRAGRVIISYTPDGGETQEIFNEDADYFRESEE